MGASVLFAGQKLLKQQKPCPQRILSSKKQLNNNVFGAEGTALDDSRIKW